MEPFPLRDCLSVTGVNGYGRSMAVGNQGQLVFKKSATELIYYDVHEISVNTLKLSKKDPLFDDCFFYDFSFVRGGTLAVCLQRPTTGELFICEGTIDPQERIVDVSGTVHPTKIFTGKGRNVNLIMDEAGVVLISYPIKWTGKDFIELFHVSNYLSAGAGDKYLISLTSKDCVDATFGNIFISRNHLYMFYGHDYSKFLLVSLAGASCGKCEIRASHGLPPSEAYISKTSLVFEDFALIYAYMNIRSTVKPNLYMLNLTNLKWIPLNLSLSHHFPNGKVTLQKLGEELIYMHGDCNVIGCTEKAHLYQINVETIMGLINSRSRSQSAGFAFGCLQYPSVSNLTKIADRRSSSVSTVMGRQSHSSETPPTTPVDNAPVIFKSDAPIVQRYKKKQSKDEQTRRRFSTLAVGKVSSSSVDSNECIKRSPSCSSLHWGADMAERSGRSLQDQIKLAHEMGYREEDVIAALNIMQGQSDQNYNAFESTNSMLDYLNQAAARQEPKLKLSVYQGNPAPEKERPSRAHSVSRSSSFHIGSPRPNRTENDDLFRLIRTLEKEKERDKREVEQQFIRLKTRIHELEHECELQKRDIERLKAENTDHSSELRERNIRLDKLMDEINAIRDNYDKETIKNSRLSKVLHEKNELIDHRRKKHEEEQCSWDKKNISLQEELEKLSLELQRKCALLDEQTTISRNLEQRNTSLQTGALLERIDEKMEARLQMDKEIVEENAMLRELFMNIRTKMPELEAAKQRAEAALETCERRRQEENDALRREINGLLEKTTSECCICLSIKPNVVFMPCKHLAICNGCEEESPSLAECPTCRAKIESTLQIYT